MTIETHRQELDRVKNFIEDAVAQIEIEGGDISAFAFSMLRAGAELTAHIEGPIVMAHNMSRLIEREELRNGTAGRA